MDTTAPIRGRRLLVFDWDGTIVDSIGRIVECHRGACADLGVVAPPRSTLEAAIGLALDVTAQRFFPGRDETFVRSFVAAYRARWLAPEAPIATPYPGVPATLETLREQGFVLAVATGKSRRGLDRELSETGLGDLFSITRCADETRSKPYPDMLLEVLERASEPAERALMIGDSEHDLQMASAAAVASIAVSYGVGDPEELLGLGPLRCIDALHELVGILEPPGPVV